MKTNFKISLLALMLIVGCKKTEQDSITNGEFEKNSLVVQMIHPEKQLIGEYTLQGFNETKAVVEKRGNQYVYKEWLKKLNQWKETPANKISADDIEQFVGKKTADNIEYAITTDKYIFAKLKGQTVIKNMYYTKTLNTEYAIISGYSAVEVTRTN